MTSAPDSPLILSGARGRNLRELSIITSSPALYAKIKRKPVSISEDVFKMRYSVRGCRNGIYRYWSNSIGNGAQEV